MESVLHATILLEWQANWHACVYADVEFDVFFRHRNVALPKYVASSFVYVFL